MAKIIEPIVDLGHSLRRKFKKVFDKLPSDYVVRSPVFNEQRIADVVIEAPNRSWLMISCHEFPPSRDDIECFLDLSKAIGSEIDGDTNIRYLAVTKEAESLFVTLDNDLINVECIEQSVFFDRAEQFITENLISLSVHANDWLIKNIFPEIRIHSACTTRRPIEVRDTKAKLSCFLLDYDQEAAAKLDALEDDGEYDNLEEKIFSLRLINGVAGCGKTLILINRAILICNKYPDKEVLLLIHNKPITRDIKFKFRKYLGGQPKNLTITTFHQFARSQKVRKIKKLRALFSERDLKPIKDRILSESIIESRGLHLTQNQAWSELEYINEFLIGDKESYLAYERQGRGFPLQRSQREEIWDLYNDVMEVVSSREQGYLPSLYIRELCFENDEVHSLATYDHILLDEAQFFSPSWLRLVIKSIKVGGHLFMCADPNQGFLKSGLSWKGLGLNARGRTKKLHYSYRTTFEILSAANAFLDLLDENPDDYIKPDLERMSRGAVPKLVYNDSPQDEQKRFLNELKSLVEEGTVPLEHIMILCADSVKPWVITKAIKNEVQKGIVFDYHAKDNSDAEPGEQMKLMTINSCTGMESGIVFVLGVGDLFSKAKAVDLSREENDLLFSSVVRKLYVAMTRAGQKLIVFSTEGLPESVTQFMDVENRLS